MRTWEKTEHCQVRRVLGGGKLGLAKAQTTVRGLAATQSCCRNAVWPFSFLLPQVSIRTKNLINGSTVSFWETDFKPGSGQKSYAS